MNTTLTVERLKKAREFALDAISQCEKLGVLMTERRAAPIKATWQDILALIDAHLSPSAELGRKADVRDARTEQAVSSCCHAYITPAGLCAECQQQTEPEPCHDCAPPPPPADVVQVTLTDQHGNQEKRHWPVTVFRNLSARSLCGCPPSRDVEKDGHYGFCPQGKPTADVPKWRYESNPDRIDPAMQKWIDTPADVQAVPSEAAYWGMFPPDRYPHMVYCNASRAKPIGCDMCSCYTELTVFKRASADVQAVMEGLSRENEACDELSNALQALRNVRDGIWSVHEAVSYVERGVQRVASIQQRPFSEELRTAMTTGAYYVRQAARHTITGHRERELMEMGALLTRAAEGEGKP
jgi:hypothetical protein